MTGIINTPEQLLELARDIVMHGACTEEPLCIYIECVFPRENNEYRISRRLGGPPLAVLGLASDPASMLDIEKLSELFYPPPVEDSEGAGEVDEDEDEELL